MASRPSPTVLAPTDSAPVKTGQKRQGGEGGAEGGKHRRTGGKNQREGGKGGEPTQRQPEPTQRQRSPRRPPWAQAVRIDAVAARTNPLVIYDIEACRCNPRYPRTNDYMRPLAVFPPVGKSPSAGNAPWFRLFQQKMVMLLSFPNFWNFCNDSDDITESESESDPLEKGKGKAGGKGNGGEGQGTSINIAKGKGASKGCEGKGNKSKGGTAGEVLGKCAEVLCKIRVAKRHLEQEWERHPGNIEQKANHCCKIAVAMDALECSSEG